MRITSFNFFVFLIISVILYYIFPKKYRWITLLVSSLFFFLSASSQVVGYFIVGALTTYLGALAIDKLCKKNLSKKIILFLIIATLMSELILLKYYNIIPMTLNLFGDLFNINIGLKKINLIAPLGISYYSLSLISYVVDVYRTTCKAQINIFKHTLFACYYPVMVSGPFIKYPEMKDELFNQKSLDWNNIYKGFHRLIYGLLKKMVIADQLALVVKAILADTATYSGFYLFFAIFYYAIQIYCDFSGCMDIVIGASKMYGVILPENFDSPFFSRTLSEFWRRWHISLGTWGKEYIMYPLLKSNLFQKFGKKTRKLFGKKYGKKIPTITAILILWLFIGIWHGASFKYIAAAGIIPWIYLTIGEFFTEPIDKLTKKLKINTETFSYHLFQSLRTLFFMMVIWFVACADKLSEVPALFKRLFVLSELNLRDTLPAIPTIPILISLILVFVVDYLNYKGINVSELFNKQNILFRWIVLLIMISIILIYGAYGSGYNPTDFIYGGF